MPLSEIKYSVSDRWCGAQGVWTDGHLVASVGLDQRLRMWTALMTAADDSPRSAADKEWLSGATASSSSCHTEMKGFTLPGHTTHLLVGSSRGAGLQPVQDVRHQIDVRECGSTVLQVLEPSALHVSPLPGLQRHSWQIAVVGRGTQIVLCSAEGGLS